jgi:molybdopterin synthase catalytic subunit
MIDWVQITADPIDSAEAIAFVTDPAAGAIDVFLGTTRAERNAAGHELVALDYEAYEAMALQQMQELARRARERWPICKIAILHRVGRVAVGQSSVIIAVSTPHRADSFAACQFMIDNLKADIAIWKKEVWDDGKTTWVNTGRSH